MAFVYINTGEKSYIMIDGFMPKTQGLVKTHGHMRISNNETDVNKRLNELHSIVGYNHLLFYNDVHKLRQNFCSEQKLTSNYKNSNFCYYECLNINEIGQMLRNYNFKRNKWMDLTRHIPQLSSEYANCNKNIKQNYIQNIIVINKPICSYSTIKLCCWNWMEKTGFEFKTKEKYINYENFVSTWIDILYKKYTHSIVRVKGEN
jgi:hypothetical protein